MAQKHSQRNWVETVSNATVRRAKSPFLLSVLGIILVWHLLTLDIPSHVFPSPVELLVVTAGLFPSDGEFRFLQHVPATLIRILLAFVIVLPVGMTIGFVMGARSMFENFLSSYVLILLTFPSIVWAFLAVIWFGLTTYLVPVFVGVMASLPFVILNVWQGTKAIDQELVEMGTAFGADRRQLWREVVFPQVKPLIFSSIRLVLAVSWKVILIAEIFGSQSGIGFIVDSYFIQQENTMLIAWSVPVLLLVYLLDRGLHRYERRQFEWRPEVEDTSTGVR